MFRTLDRHVLCEWLKIFAIMVSVMIGILIMDDMYRTLGKLFELGVPTWRILQYYCYLMPSLVPVILPVSMLLSFIFTLSALHRNNEITAMRAAGMNDFRITRSLWIASVLIAVLFFWMNGSVIPRSKEVSRKIYDSALIERSAKNNTLSDASIVNNLCFNNRKNSRLWYMNSFSRNTNVGNGVTVSILDSKDREIARIMARRGVYDDVDKCWFFLDGQEIEYDAARNKSVRAVGFDKKYYRNFTERPQIMILSMARPQDLSLFENNTVLEALGGDDDFSDALPYLVRKYSIWASPMICLIVLAIAIPFSITGVRVNPVVGVTKTMGAFFAYFIIDSIMTALGGNGLIPPAVAALVPPVAVAVWTVFLYRKHF